jgi:hypothetical protein
MMRGINQRTAVAITLIGVVMLLSGMSLLPASPTATHSCCLRMNMACESSQASCCTAGPQVPPASVTPAFLGMASVEVVQSFTLAIDRPDSRDAAATAVVPFQSPPPGAFSLRI